MPKDAVASTRYRIDSADDDAGLSGISFVLHGNSSVQDSNEIFQNGLVVQEGRATVSSDLSMLCAGQQQLKNDNLAEVAQ